ncbi:MAG TPA: phosphate ABC transporter permease subunit PstC [Ktedonobacteraceae bacterium]|jgi:phosphate transport system permease protein
MLDTLTSRRRWGEAIIQNLFLLCAVLIVLVICGVFIFVGYNGLQLFTLDHTNAGTFFTSTNWNLDPTEGKVSYGALGYILGSIVTTVFAILIVTPLALGMAAFMTELCPKWLENILRPLLEIFTGMPSVVIGFLGLVVLVPWVGRLAAPIAPLAATAGYGWATASLVLVIMVLPTVVSISIDALRAVPASVREASLALGSTRWQTIRNAVIPAAKTGLATAILLGTGRAIGETFAVTMVLKAQNALPANVLTPGAFFQPNINVPLGIVSYFSEAPTPAAHAACIMLGFVLLIISFLFMCISRFLASKGVYK